MKNIIAYSMDKLYKDLEVADDLFLSSYAVRGYFQS